MTVGIPRAFFFHRYGIMWESFLSSLNVKVIKSDLTNARILDAGVRNCASEACVPMKIFLGHVESLIGRCDKILIPLTVSEDYCVRFNALYDIVKATFPLAPIVDFIAHENDEEKQLKEYLRLAKTLLSASVETALKAYRRARLNLLARELEAKENERLALKSGGIKILICAHSYILHDEYLGGALKKIIEENNAAVLFSDAFDKIEAARYAKNFAPQLFWQSNIEALGAALANKSLVDGVIFLTVFPCATDALSGEILTRKLSDTPVMTVVLDGSRAEAGLITRVESFVDILRQKQKSNVTEGLNAKPS